jgi:hypothetical protein
LLIKTAPSEKVSVVGWTKLTLRKTDGKTIYIPVNHPFNYNQIKWFKAGSYGAVKAVNEIMSLMKEKRIRNGQAADERLK